MKLVVNPLGLKTGINLYRHERTLSTFLNNACMLQMGGQYVHQLMFVRHHGLRANVAYSYRWAFGCNVAGQPTEQEWFSDYMARYDRVMKQFAGRQTKPTT